MQAPRAELAIPEQASEFFFGDQPQMVTFRERVQFSDLQLVCRGQHSHDVPLLVLEDDRFRYALARDMSGLRRVQAVPGVAMRDDVIRDPLVSQVPLDRGGDGHLGPPLVLAALKIS